MHTGFIIRINEEHVGRCIAAIRRRWANEVRYERKVVRQERELAA